MWLLLCTTITASFFDSLNPSAIAQQMLLQAMVKQKRHTLYFILGIGTANLAMGLAVYYGIAAWASVLLEKLVSAYPQHMYGAAVAVGLLCLAVGIRLVVKTARNTKCSRAENETKAPVRLSPLALFGMGAVFCGVELTSAFPYFGFIAMLSGYALPFPLALLFILLYNFIYVLPLLLLYFGYNRLRGTTVIQRLEAMLGKVSAYIVPVVVGLLGVLLFLYGASALL